MSYEINPKFWMKCVCVCVHVRARTLGVRGWAGHMIENFSTLEPNSKIEKKKKNDIKIVNALTELHVVFKHLSLRAISCTLAIVLHSE